MIRLVGWKLATQQHSVSSCWIVNGLSITHKLSCCAASFPWWFVEFYCFHCVIVPICARMLHRHAWASTKKIIRVSSLLSIWYYDLCSVIICKHLVKKCLDLSCFSTGFAHVVFSLCVSVNFISLENCLQSKWSLPLRTQHAPLTLMFAKTYNCTILVNCKDIFLQCSWTWKVQNWISILILL